MNGELIGDWEFARFSPVYDDDNDRWSPAGYALYSYEELRMEAA